MTLALTYVRLARWVDRPGWLQAGDVPADPLTDLRTNDNALSFWSIHDDQRNLRQVAAALASGRDNVQNFDYVLVDLERLEELAARIGFEIHREQHGRTAYEAVNHYHFDVTLLTASRLVEIAQLLLDHGHLDRLQLQEVGQLLDAALNDGSITKVNDRLRSDLEKRRSGWTN